MPVITVSPSTYFESVTVTKKSFRRPSTNFELLCRFIVDLTHGLLTTACDFQGLLRKVSSNFQKFLVYLQHCSVKNLFPFGIISQINPVFIFTEMCFVSSILRYWMKLFSHHQKKFEYSMQLTTVVQPLTAFINAFKIRVCFAVP